MPSCRPTHTHTHPPCHLAARHRSEPCPPAPASRCTATLHFRCPAAVLMRKPAPERKPELKPGPDPPYGNTPRNRRFRRAFPSAHGARHLTTEQLAAHFRRHTTAAALIPRHTPSHTSAPEHASAPERASAPGTHIHAGPADPHCRSAPSTHARTKKRSTLADASPLFGNVESVTRPERNACRQLR